MFFSCRPLAWRSFRKPLIDPGLAGVQVNAVQGSPIPESVGRALRTSDFCAGVSASHRSGRAEKLSSVLATCVAPLGLVASAAFVVLTVLSPTPAQASNETMLNRAGTGFSTRVDDSATSRALGTVSLGQLPPQAQATDRLIHQGGPFPYPKDGIVFGNRERSLPRQARGFYHEYTVPTPGAHNRGARRIVCGGNPPNRPEACYYTDDHYQTFRRIAP